ncbi:DNA cytosine methyltransferase [Sulfurimonas crateris]|uniref:Cytosine-specific methyltransferase n=1 Tax=Sulfurimonas crateris TaxID=2574727 RepID=A0A4U2Z969_9BACT|nr:DNA cytosine methyltransferase [Sulfurimonas crateris]TKI71016.1 DNA cytosine methyltransferase [Sulfurimonas crateris]
MKYNYIDLFAGCGGLTDGFEQTNKYIPHAFVEWDKNASNTLKHRLNTKWNIENVDEKVLHFDIQRMDELLNGFDDEEYGKHIGLKRLVNNTNIDVIIGGPPCQAYSLAGRVQDKNNMKCDYRNYLFENYLKVVKEFKPKLFVFENVQGILSAMPDGVNIIDRIRDDFEKEGYVITSDLKKTALLDSSDYGVPQIRKRVIIIGINKELTKHNSEDVLEDFYLNILPSFKVDKKITVKEAISDLEPLYPLNENHKYNVKKVSHHKSNIANHIPRFHSPRDIEIFNELALDVQNGSKKYPNIDSLKQLYYEKTGKKSSFHKYNVLAYEKQSNTIPAHLHKDGLRHIHPDPKQARSITPREAARLQTFDDDFEFLGSQGACYQMIGNAVPPLLAKKVALAVDVLLKKYFI